jgi:hypothetical protein
MCPFSFKTYIPALARAFVITSWDISTLFCRRSDMIRFVYLGQLSWQQKDKKYVDILFSSLDIPIDQHLMEASLDDCRHKPTVVSPYSLHPQINATNNPLKMMTNLNPLRIHLVPFVWLGPVKSCVPLLADEKIRVVNFFELEFDRSDEFCRYKVRCIRPYGTVKSGCKSGRWSMLTQSHDPFQLRRPELDHDGVRVTINDFSIMRVAILNREFCFDLLQKVNNWMITSGKTTTCLFGLLDHLTPICCHTGGNRKAWQFSNRSTSESINGVRADLEVDETRRFNVLDSSVAPSKQADDHPGPHA